MRRGRPASFSCLNPSGSLETDVEVCLDSVFDENRLMYMPIDHLNSELPDLAILLITVILKHTL